MHEWDGISAFVAKNSYPSLCKIVLAGEPSPVAPTYFSGMQISS